MCGLVQGAAHDSPIGCATARMIRLSVRSSPIRHSQTRRTLQPSFRSLRLTRRSRRRFDTILALQKPVLLFDGRSQLGQPCQKHPSTKTTTLAFENTKSGLPQRAIPRRQPVRCHFLNSLIRQVSVVRFPRDRIRDILYERWAFVCTSVMTKHSWVRLTVQACKGQGISRR